MADELTAEAPEEPPPPRTLTLPEWRKAIDAARLRINVDIKAENKAYQAEIKRKAAAKLHNTIHGKS